MFPEPVINSVFALRNSYKGKKNHVIMSYPIIEIVKYRSDRETSLKLFYYESTNTFEIQPPDSKFYNKISFYDFAKTERRWIRNKDFLFSLINDLKRCGIWDLVSNKDFLILNSNNEKAEEMDRLSALKKIVGEK